VGFWFREKNDEYYRFFLVKEQKEIFICSVCSMCLTTEEKIKVLSEFSPFTFMKTSTMSAVIKRRVSGEDCNTAELLP
jgi:hypothetical protein